MSVKHKIVAKTKTRKVSSVKATKAEKKKEQIEKKAQSLAVYYRNPSPVGEKLNVQQIEFCQLFTDYNIELFGNGARCYLAVYGAEYFRKNRERMEYSVAASAASRLLTNVKIIAYINTLLEEGGFNDVNIDKQLLFIINQNGDLRAKLGGIREFNNLRKRVDNRPVLVQGNNITFQKFGK